MSFRITARVIAQLGAELISADDVALFELVKNGFDAGSPSVSISIHYRVGQSEISKIQHILKSKHESKRFSPKTARKIVEEELLKATSNASANCNLDTDSIEEVACHVGNSSSLDDAIGILGALTSIEILDTGSGMSLSDLDDYFLTIGTTHRMEQQEEAIQKGKYRDGVLIAGEKGIGRLSAMRLGNYLKVMSWQAGTDTQVVMKINWRLFLDNPSANPSDIPIERQSIPRTHPKDASGTLLTISGLTSQWDRKKVDWLALNKLSKFVDPFSKKKQRRIRLQWNGDFIDVGGLNKPFLAASHNGMKGNVALDNKGLFSLNISYWFTRIDKITKERSRHELTRKYSAEYFSDLSDDVIAKIGPFSFELFHYNRRYLTDIPEVEATRHDVRKWLDEWCGGLMLYRDGLRVLPYGTHPDDDWLELDQRALRGKGFRVNRIQVVGCVRISRTKNPLLVDQTNREGLQDNEASLSFKRFLRRIIDECFVSLYREHVEVVDHDDPDQIVAKAGLTEDELSQAVNGLINAVESGNSRKINNARLIVESAMKKVRHFAGELEAIAVAQRVERIEIAELAGKGLAAEAVAHDIEGVLDNSISAAGELVNSKLLSQRLHAALRHLIAVLKSARAQIASIKPGPSKRRRRRGKLDLISIIKDVADLFEPRFIRHDITYELSVKPEKSQFIINVVEGHVRQVLENIIRNSIFWVLDSAKNRSNGPRPSITIECDIDACLVTIRDSGVGFAVDETEWVFTALNTHRDGGHGLGLAIARELCEYNNMTIEVDHRRRNQWNRFSGITLDFTGCAAK